ncbi:hypothetical protein [Ponticaulis sp.]|uniref:hypothetical protein n=1 Tax=Ponticaulis sp. TaxID=2020902 RepID=UPI000B75404A|nr:hypothetical protein [Ponticaulis sp.]MAI90887.1 hypothetical protein [Ponticaulis sp.]OUX98737.1 MAG: hypothetical protein CBB65_10620 [Hyphomonadaceae bacterium TMED5]
MDSRETETLITHVLRGQYTPQEKAEFDTRLETDAEFRALVEEMTEWLKPADASEDELGPSPSLLSDLLSKLDDEPKEG